MLQMIVPAHDGTTIAMTSVPCELTGGVKELCILQVHRKYMKKNDEKRKKSPSNQVESYFGTKVGTTPLGTFSGEVYQAWSFAQTLLENLDIMRGTSEKRKIFYYVTNAVVACGCSNACEGRKMRDRKDEILN